jgi:hypothetical protein
METINWRRVVLGGMVAGVVLIVLATASTVLFLGQQQLRTAVQALRPSTSGVVAPLFFVFAFLFLGILMTWWYAAILPRFGTGPKTAVIAGFAVWLTAVGFFLKSVAMYEPDLNVTGPMWPMLYLLMMVVSTVAGAQVYKEQER